jgi:hypothetical protein
MAADRQHMNRFLLFVALPLLFFTSCKHDAIEEPTDSPDNRDPQLSAPLLQVAVETNGNTIVDEPKVMASMRMTAQGTMVYDGSVGIEYRGCSSQMFDKKSYGFETWDMNGEDMDVALAGFPAEEDWILYGPFSDKALLRNVVIYALSNEIGRYATRTAFCELYLNGRYEGI